MHFFLALVCALPQDYMNLIMEKKYDEVISYCDGMINKNKNRLQWELEKGDIYYQKLVDLDKALEIYQGLVDKYKQKDGWIYYRIAQVLELKEDYLNSARMYEIVATQYRKPPLDSFSLTGVERCFKKNYQDYVATVDGYNITRLEFDEIMSKAPAFKKQDEKTILDQIIVERLIYTNAITHDVMNTAFFRDKLQEEQRNLLVNEVHTYDVLSKSIPSEKEMKKYYKEHKGKYKTREEVHGKEIVVASESLAQFLLDSLKKEVASFDTLAKLYSTGPNKRRSGNMGVVYRGSQPKPVEEALFKTKPDSLTGIIEFDNKYGIYLVTKYNPERYRDFESVKSQVEAELKAERIRDVEQKLLNKLKRMAKLKIFEDTIDAIVKDTTGKADVIIAKISGRSILWRQLVARGEKVRQFAPISLTNADMVRDLLNRFIEEELRVEWAERNKYYLHDGYFARFKEAVPGFMSQGLYRKIVLDAVSVDSQEVWDEYNKRREEFKIYENVRGKEIVVDSRKLANEIHQLLQKEPDMFDSLITVYSLAASKGREGNTGVVRKGMRSKEFDDVVFKLKPDQISKVFIENDSNYTIIKLIEHNPESYRIFEEVRPSLETSLLRQRQATVANEFLERIKEEANIEIYLSEPEEEGTEETDKRSEPVEEGQE